MEKVHLLIIIFYMFDFTMYLTTIYNEGQRGERYRAVKFLAIITITVMMAMPLIQNSHSEFASTPSESYSYGNEMVRFVGPNAFIGYDGNMFPVSWKVLEANPNYSPGPHVNFFGVSTNNSNKSAPLIEETFKHYTTKRIETVWQNSVVMIEWNHYVKIAEIFSFTRNGINASIVIKNLNITNAYISAFYLGMGVNSSMAVNGFNPSCQNISSGMGIIPSSDWEVSVGNISVNWQSEDSIFHGGIVSETSLGDQIILPFETGVIYHNQSYTIDPLICYHPDVKTIIHTGGSECHGTTLPQHSITFKESGLPYGTNWYVTLDGVTESATSNSISFYKYNGQYSYIIGSVNGYTISPSIGTVCINNSNKYVSVSYARHFYSLKFTESGLPSGTSWSLQLNGNTLSTTSSSMTFTEPNGTYSYSIGSISGYAISPSSGNANIDGGSKKVSVTFTDMIGPVSVNYSLTDLDGSLNLQSEIYYNTHRLGERIENTSFMLPAELSSIDFNIPYFDANMGNGQVNPIPYISASRSTVSPDEISGPPPGNGGSPFRGMLVYTLTWAGSVDFQIYCNQDLSGNGVVSFSWTTQPGAYGGFMIEFVNNNGVARYYYRHPFDVYSRLIMGTDTKCIGDSAAYTSIYSSSGVYIGKLAITASGGPSISAIPYNRHIPLGLTSIFTSPDNNASVNKYTYGVFNYTQCLKFTGSQFGNALSQPIYEPICILSQSYSTNVNTGSSIETNAVESIYDLTEAGLPLTADPYLMGTGLTMAALGPFLFSGAVRNSGVSGSYWNDHFKEDGIRYLNWNPNNTKMQNQPPYSWIQLGWVERTAPFGFAHIPVDVPVFTIVNNGRGNPSYIHLLNMIMYNQPENSVVNRSFQRTLNYYTYSARETIVPIIHSYTFCGNTYPITQNDYVFASLNSNGDWTYNGPSYTGAVSLQLYIPMEG